MKRKTVFIFSSVGVLSLFVSIYATKLGLCSETSIFCWQDFQTAAVFLVIFIPILIFSAITYFTQERAFRAWLKFTLWYVPLFWVITAYLSSKLLNSGSGIAGAYNGGAFLIIFLFMIAVFVIASLLIIAPKDPYNLKKANHKH